jgi:hypothetical protein
MIDLYYWPTPNGHKVTLFLEAEPDYRIHPVDISTGDQFRPLKSERVAAGRGGDALRARADQFAANPTAAVGKPVASGSTTSPPSCSMANDEIVSVPPLRTNR